MIYSNTILTEILGPDSAFSPRMGTICIGAASFFSAICSIWTIKWWGRRPLLLVGHTGIAICHICIGVFIMINFNVGVLSGICLFLFFYQTTTGQIAWVYAAETCVDITLGVAINTLWGTVLVLLLVTEPLMNSKI
jgi:hypothetical protein